MFNGGTDGEWEKWGRDDPYFGVLTDGKFRMVNLTDANRAEFFRSGSEYIDGVLRTVRSHIDPAFRIRRALDFGCGVGRLVIPLSKVAEHVTGLDVSDSMLAEARRNCEAHGARGVQFLKSDDGLSALEGKFDFIHSSLVFQHIPVRRGERIFRNFLGHLEAGGVCVVHFTYAKGRGIGSMAASLKNWVPYAVILTVRRLRNLLRGRRVFAPHMQMNSYALNRLFFEVQKAGVRECHAQFTDHGGALGVVLYFQRPKEA